MKEAKRFNEGKTRHDLIPPFAQEEYAKVLTFGAEIYGENNWKIGMSWKKVIASLERHLQAIKAGVDYDEETGLLHAAHVMCNAAFLTEYYQIHPQGDDRVQYKSPKIGLDIDEVLADWVGHYCSAFEMEVPKFWNFDRNIIGRFEGLTEEFWSSIPVKTEPDSIPFEPHCYITSRPIPTEQTEAWLDKHGFPFAPVYTVQGSKVEVALSSGLDIFVDDRYKNFVELNNAGICCYLYDAPHNQRYNVGHKRIKNLNEL